MALMPNSYSRDPWVRTFINTETAVMMIYLDDSAQSSQCPVSILRDEKGDRRQTDYAPDQEAQLSAKGPERACE
jgi:hypothetical protein